MTGYVILPPMQPAPQIPVDIITVSIVVFRSDQDWFRQTVDALVVSIKQAIDHRQLRSACLVVIDNDPQTDACRGGGYSDIVGQALAGTGLADIVTHQIVNSAKNLGYGAANNLAFRHIAGDVGECVLVLNPDVALAPEAIAGALLHLARHPACGMVTPVATFPDGTPQYLVKAAPSVLTLALRGFAPAWLKSLFAPRLAVYDRMETAFDAPLHHCEIVSGCAMFIRGSVWKTLGGFDERFFLYFEDFDLSKRIAGVAGIDRVATCKIIHAGGNAAGKGGGHVWLFVRSAARFFNKHGWRW